MTNIKREKLGVDYINGAEGASTRAIVNSEVVFHDPINVIEFLLDEKTRLLLKKMKVRIKRNLVISN